MRAPAASIATALALTLGLSACSIPDQSRPDVIGPVPSTTQPPAVVKAATPTSAHVTTFLVGNDAHLVAVRRSDPYDGLNVAVGELLAGPTSGEVAKGLTSAIPVGTKLSYSNISGSTADLDFSSELASVSGHEQLLAFAQIVETAVSIPGITFVRVSVAGQVVNAPEPDGTLAQGPVTGSDYSSLLLH